FAASHIFWRNRSPLPTGLTPNLELMPCVDAAQEAEAIGRRVKSLLLDGVSSGEIAVVYRNLSGIATALQAAFNEFGVPLNSIQHPSLAGSAVCGFLLSVLDAVTDWPRTEIAGILTSPWFRPEGMPDPALADAFPLLSRLAQIVAGQHEWHVRVESLADRIERKQGEEIERLVRKMPDAQAAVEALRTGLRLLDEKTGAIPVKATVAQFAAAMDGLVEDLGVPNAVRRYLNVEIAASEAAALKAFRNLLGAMAAWHEGDPERIPRAEFAMRLRRAVQETSYEPESRASGVACIDAAAVRHMRYDYVFFGGVNEGETPAPPQSNAIYSDVDLEALREAGIVLDDKRVHSARELLLFHHVLESPRKRLVISWHALSRRGQEKLPSPYVADLREVLGGALTVHKAALDACAPPPEAVASWRDLRNVALQRQSPDPTEPLLNRARVGAAIERARHGSAPFDAFDGRIADETLRATVAAQFGEGHVFSVNQIETFAACPFRFFIERLLDVDETEIPEAEFDARVRGQILHAVLQAFHERFRGIPAAAIPAKQACAAMAEAVEEQFGAKAHWSRTAPRGVFAVERQRLEQTLDRYLHIERDRAETQWRPEHFEAAFGPDRGGSRDPLSTDQPFTLSTDAGPVPFAGRIDRIDLSEAGARIVDYKTTLSVQLKDIKEGRSLQLAVYALALEGLLMSGTECAEACFIQPGSKDRREALGRNEKKFAWNERRIVAMESIARAVTAIRDGRFPPVRGSDDACKFCMGAGICRWEETRIERKKAAP
ncbi:MAG: UvrD-like helicase C-terminal protein, partial [Candidatus Hydrogenedentes bacterium]|nr:UvrD-like helicase C-terminal protein [Candidatus Hydrogenedentota bacterium]